jgi:hypothetical protein
MPTFTKIASNTVGSGGVATVTFSSIPATYTDLVLYATIRCTTGEDSAYLRFNNDSGSNYSWKRLLANGASVSTLGATGQAQIPNLFMVNSGWTGNTFASNMVYIPNYASSNAKSVSIDAAAEANVANPRMNIAAGLWSGTAAISQVNLISGAGNFAQYSTFTLYGISNA